jgi:hypothetical protein
MFQRWFELVNLNKGRVKKPTKIEPGKAGINFADYTENIRLEPWGLLPSGALNAPPTILSSNYFELKHTIFEPILEK